MKSKKKVKVNRYRLGTQQVAVPDKGGLDTIASPLISTSSTGASIGGMFGPVGMGVGAGIGAATGLVKGLVDKSAMNKANRVATNQNKYNIQNDRLEDPNLMQMQEFGKGSRYVKAKYPGGTGGVKTAKQLSEESRKKRAAQYGNTNKAAEINTEAITLGKNEHGLPAGDQQHKKPIKTKRGPARFRADNEYPDGTQAIKLTPEEIALLDTARNNTSDPNAFRTTLWDMLGYVPQKYPAGSDGWKTQQTKFDNAVDLANQGFKATVTPGKMSVTKKNSPIATAVTYEEGTKEIEVEKDELIFSKKGNKYLLRADFKGGKTHAQGGEDYTAQEGDIIFPGKQRKKVLNAYKRGDTSTLEAMRMNLPKDLPNKAQLGYGGIDPDFSSNYQTLDPYSYEDLMEPTILPEVNMSARAYENVNELPEVSMSRTANENVNILPDVEMTGKRMANWTPKTNIGQATNINRPSMQTVPVTTNTSTYGSNDLQTSGTKGTGVAGAIGTGLELAPILYNTFRGLSKPTKVQRNYYNPEKYQYNDISNPARRAAQEAYNVDKYNVNTTRGSRGQIQSYLQSASNNKYKRLADIGNFEGGRKMDVFNRNTELSNQAGLTNLQLSNQYNDIDAQNRGKRNDFLASATGQVSQFAQKNDIQNQMRQRDEKLMAMDKQRLNLYGSMYNNYTPDYTTDANGNINFSGIKYRSSPGYKNNNYSNPKYRTKKESRTGFVKP